MRNDFGTRPYKSRFPYKKGGSAKRKKFKLGTHCKNYRLQQT